MFRNPLEEQGGEGRACLHRTHYAFPPKKSSLRALRAHNERTYISGTSCAGTRRVPFVECSSLGSQNMGDGSDGEALSGAQKRAEMLHHPCILGGPQRQARGQNQKWLPHP